jgi:hypothetical protein
MADAAAAVRRRSAESKPKRQAEPPVSLAERIALVKPPCFWPAMPGKPPLSAVERAGLIRLASSVPGTCCEEEMVAFIEAMRHAPAGDVVELGSGYGRTAALLVWLACRHEVGAVLCLDNWSASALADFEVDLAPLAAGRLNYVNAGTPARDYAANMMISTKTFGVTRYDGRIALLHMCAADPDCGFWISKVAPAGWIVFGPDQSASRGRAKPLAESFVEANSARISSTFRAGDSLFVQLKRNASPPELSL